MANPSDENDPNWLVRSIKSAQYEVAKWPEWKKKAMRVIIEKPEEDNNKEKNK